MEGSANEGGEQSERSSSFAEEGSAVQKFQQATQGLMSKMRAAGGVLGKPRASLAAKGGLRRTTTRDSGSKKKSDKRFDLKISPVKLEIEPTSTQVFRVQVRNPGMFKVLSKKYRVDSPEGFEADGRRRFNGYVEFENDHLAKRTGIARDISTGAFSEKKILVEVLMADAIIFCQEMDLSKFTEMDGPKKMVFSGENRPFKALTLIFDLAPVIDDDQSSVSQFPTQEPERKQSIEVVSHQSNRALNEENQQLKEEIARLKEQLSSVPKSAEEFQQQLQEKEEVISELQSKLAQEQEQSEAQVSQSRAIQDLQAQLQARDAEIAKLQLKAQEADLLSEEVERLRLDALRSDPRQVEQSESEDRPAESNLDENTAQLVRNLQQELSSAEKEREEVKGELVHSKMLLNEQLEKLEKFELMSRKLKKQNKILENFIRIETRSPQSILDEFRSGRMSDDQMLSGYMTSGSNSARVDGSPFPYSYKAVSKYNLDIDSNIY